jgi:5-methylthioadenosine/S-adenosylhomocysteine deaminase
MPIYLSVTALLSGAILSSCGRSAAEVSGVDGQTHAERIGEAAAALTHQKTLIHNASLVLTMDPSLGDRSSLGMLENGDVLLQGNQIVAVGQNLVAHGDVEEIDASGKIVMPGFVDVHDHLWQSIERGCGLDKDVTGWISECNQTVGRPDTLPPPNTQAPLSAEEVYAAVRLSTLDLIGTGVTTVADYSHAFTTAFAAGDVSALEDSGLRFVFVYRGTANAATLNDIRRIKSERIDPNPLASLQLAAPLNSTDVLAMFSLAEEMNTLLHVHLVENIRDRGTGLDSEAIPITLLKNACLPNGHCAFGPRLVAAHSVHLNDCEITDFASAGVRVAHNPASNMRLASGVMRAGAMHTAGVRLGLGLDGGTNDTADMFVNMRNAIGLQRAAHAEDPQYSSLCQAATIFPTVVDALRLATVGGAEILGLQDRIGSLTPGKQADLLVINPSRPNFAPRINWPGQIIFNGRPENVEWVFVAGKALKKHRKLHDVDEAEIVEAAEQVAVRARSIIAVAPQQPVSCPAPQPPTCTR